MNRGKTKPPSKEFSAQVSDYIPTPKRKRPWTLDADVEPVSVAHQTPKVEPTVPGSEFPSEKQKRPWLFSEFSTDEPSIQNLVVEKTGHKPDTNRLQSGHKPDTELGFTQLVGLQRKVLILIYRACQSARGRTTEALSLEHISKSLGIRTGSVKTTLRRLEEKGCILRKDFKNGRGGWSKYELPDSTFTALLQLETGHKLDTNWTQSGHKVDTQPDTQPDTRPSSSSSSLRSLIKKEELLTTSEVAQTDQLDLDASWQTIDYSSLTEIRFGRHQLAQIAREGKFTPEELQDSIYAFAFDLSENGKAKTITGVPLNYFMGILRRGPYAAPSNYESPDVRQKRLYLESKEQQRKKRQELNDRLETVEFDEWLEKLSLDQRAAIVPPKDFAKPGGTAHNYQMREYFRESVWPKLRDRTLQENPNSSKTSVKENNAENF